MANYTVTITGDTGNFMSKPYAFLNINGEPYGSPQTMMLASGTVIIAYAETVTLNGKSVGSPMDSDTVAYSHTLTSDLQISITRNTLSSKIALTTSGGGGGDDSGGGGGGEIGKTLIGGTARTISEMTAEADTDSGGNITIIEGKVLINGTVRTIKAAASEIPVTITGTGSTTLSYVRIGGTRYTEAGETVVETGEVITFAVYGYSTASTRLGYVRIDGTTVLSVSNRTMKTYQWTVPDGVTAIRIAMAINGTYCGRVIVTTS